MVNADRYLIISGQRTYFYDQKQYYLNEIDRLTKIFEKAYFKKRKYKSKSEDLEKDILKFTSKYDADIEYLRKKVNLKFCLRLAQNELIVLLKQMLIITYFLKCTKVMTL